MTGAFTRNETGTDLYTLSESGTLSGSGTFAETVTGTDAYSINDVGNTALQTDVSTTTGGGAWTRTASGAATAGSGTNGYTLVESGDALVGSFSQSETGTDRYGLVEAFDNVANDASGNTPGNVSFHSVGLPFRDPTIAVFFSLVVLPATSQIAADPALVIEADQEGIDKFKKQFEDGRLGYNYTLVYSNVKNGSRVWGLQAVENYKFVVLLNDGKNGKLSTPGDQKTVTMTYKIDQVNLTQLTKAFPDQRAWYYDLVLPNGGTIVGAKSDLLKPGDKAVFAFQIVRTTVGLSNPGYAGKDNKSPPITGPSGAISNVPVEQDNYKFVQGKIATQKTETRSVYIYYNPIADPKNPIDAAFVFKALEADPVALKAVKEALEKDFDKKLILGGKVVEGFSFPNVMVQGPRGKPSTPLPPIIGSPPEKK